MVDGLSDMIVERLRVYERKNRVLPERMFVYRDGVSEVCPLCRFASQLEAATYMV